MKKPQLIGLSAAAITSGFLLSSTAFAQFQAQAQADTQGQTGGQAGMGLPQPAPAENAGTSDHDQMIGRFAVGYMGRRDMLIATSNVAPATATLTAPVIGVRLWLNQLLGLDLGAGLVIESGEIDQENTPGGPAQDPASIFGVMVHGGIPLSFAQGQHYSFQLVPEANIGYAQSTQDTMLADLTYTGFHLDIGARVGAEIHFGFMDIPQLSLQGGVGVNLAVDRTSGTADTTPEVSTSVSQTSLRTTVGDNPWNIFVANVGALYYF